MTAHFRPAVYDLPRDGHTVFRWEHPPQQATVELERRQRKQSLAAAFRVFARLGFDMGGAGHITVRDPGARTISGSTRWGCISAMCGCRTCCWSTPKAR